MQFTNDLKPMVQGSCDIVKPLQSKQSQIDRTACERQHEINRLQEIRETHGLKTDGEKEFEKLLAIQST